MITFYFEKATEFWQGVDSDKVIWEMHDKWVRERLKHYGRPYEMEVIQKFLNYVVLRQGKV